MPSSPSRIHPDQLNKVRTFKSSLTELGALYSTFDELAGLESSVRSHLSMLAQKYELGNRRVNLLALINLAKIFRAPVEQLMGMTEAAHPIKHRLSPAGIRHAERFQQLSKTQQCFVKKIMDVLLEQTAAAGN
jgi:hypothetical protein